MYRISRQAHKYPGHLFEPVRELEFFVEGYVVMKRSKNEKLKSTMTYHRDDLRKVEQ